MQEYITFVQSHPFLFAGLAVIVFFIIKVEFDRMTRKYKQVKPEEAVSLMNRDDITVLDVREDKEVSGGKLQGAKHIPLGLLSKRLPELQKRKSNPILVYCRSGQRSAFACRQLTKEGFEDVYNLAGGISGWETANLPTYR